MLSRILAGLFASLRWRTAKRLVVLLVLVQATAALAAPPSPMVAAGVVDEAHLLPAEAVASIAVKLKALEERTADHFVVATVTSLQGETIDEYAYQLGRAWGIDQKNRDNVVILLVAPNERKVRIEVGYALRSHLTDILSQTIIDNAIVPRFRVHDMVGGIENGVDAVIQVLDGNAK